MHMQQCTGIIQWLCRASPSTSAQRPAAGAGVLGLLPSCLMSFFCPPSSGHRLLAKTWQGNHRVLSQMYQCENQRATCEFQAQRYVRLYLLPLQHSIAVSANQTDYSFSDSCSNALLKGQFNMAASFEDSYAAAGNATCVIKPKVASSRKGESLQEQSLKELK